MSSPGPGGYQAPARPAPVSGPGALSARTDGGPQQGVVALPDAKYGENKAFVDQQQGAPLSKTPNQPTAPVSAGAGPGGPPSDPGMGMGAPAPLDLVHMAAPTGRPNEPVTAGAALGAGPGPAPTPDPAPMSVTQAMRPYAANDHSGQMAALLWSLSEMGL